MGELDHLVAEAELGEAARNFVDSELGQCVLGMAKQQIEEARSELEDVDPDDAKQVTSAQNKAKLARMFNQWLVELIDNGNAAMEQYKHGTQE